MTAIIEPWEPQAHYWLIDSWLRKRGMDSGAGSIDGYPTTGFIVNSCVAGFLYRTDSAICYLDSYCSDPAVTKELRETSLVHLTRALLSSAKELGFRAAWATTSSPTLVSVADGFGFDVRPGFSSMSKGF